MRFTELEVVRRLIAAQHLSPEAAEDCLVLVERFGGRYALGEILVRRGYLSAVQLDSVAHTLSIPHADLWRAQEFEAETLMDAMQVPSVDTDVVRTTGKATDAMSDDGFGAENETLIASLSDLESASRHRASESQVQVETLEATEEQRPADPANFGAAATDVHHRFGRFRSLRTPPRETSVWLEAVSQSEAPGEGSLSEMPVWICRLNPSEAKNRSFHLARWRHLEAIHSPYILGVVDSGERASEVFVVLERFDDRALSDVLPELDAWSRVRVVRDVAGAMAALPEALRAEVPVDVEHVRVDGRTGRARWSGLADPPVKPQPLELRLKQLVADICGAQAPLAETWGASFELESWIDRLDQWLLAPRDAGTQSSRPVGSVWQQGLLLCAVVLFAPALALSIDALFELQVFSLASLVRWGVAGASFGLMGSLLLLLGVGLVRRGRLPLPRSTYHLVMAQEGLALGSGLLLFLVLLGGRGGVYAKLLLFLALVLVLVTTQAFVFRTDIASRGVFRRRVLATLGHPQMVVLRYVQAPITMAALLFSSAYAVVLFYFRTR